MKAALIVNPASGRRSGKGMALAEALRSRPAVRVVVLQAFDGLAEHLRALATDGVDTLFISSGDGTVQAIQTELGERSPFPALPRLALLPHGTTNLTAGDLGLKVSGTAALAALIGGEAPEPATALRSTLRVANPRDGRARHGMFLGAGAIAAASEFCQRKVHATGLKGDLANFAVLAKGVAEALFRSGGDRQDRIVRPYPMRAAVDGRPWTQGPQLLLLATTLDRLILASRPFWGPRTAPIRLTAIAHPPPSIPRWLPAILYGGEDRKVPDSCLSVSASRLDLETADTVLLDGEFFEAPTGEPLRVESGPVFTYLRR